MLDILDRVLTRVARATCCASRDSYLVLLNKLGRVCVLAGVMFGLPGHAKDGVSAASIVIGQSTAHRGPGSGVATGFLEGAKLYFEHANREGGVNGRRIRLESLDDHGSPELARDNTAKLVKGGVLALFGYYGSAQVAAAYPLIHGSDVLLFAPMAGADELRGPEFPQIYTLRPSYSVEAAAIARHAATLGARRMAMIAAADAESKVAVASTTLALQKHGASVVAEASLSTGSIANTVDRVLAANPESILVITPDANAAANAVRDLRAKNFRGLIYGYSNTGESLLAEVLGAEGAGVVAVRVVPKSENPRASAVLEMLELTRAANRTKPNVYMVEGYLSAKLLVTALRAIKGEPTQAKLRAAVAALRNVDLGGFVASYADTRAASTLVQLSVIDSQGKVRD
jgi:branched-chain amino acid transport system substrate-binding protein